MAKLYFFYGSMGAAKSAALLMADFNYRERGMSTCLFTSAKDDRSGKGRIKSRIGLESDAYSISETEDVFDTIINKIKKSGKPDIIMFDEAQFLTPEQVEQITHIVDMFDIDAMCYGLRTDFKTKMFPGSKRLMELCDTITELKTMCHCGNKATINARIKDGQITREGEQIVTGDTSPSDSKKSIHYVALCRKCWHENKIS